MSDMADIVEVAETKSVGEANLWLSFVGVCLLSVAQDPYGVARYVIGRTAENKVIPWGDPE
jgi:hypothetical protein